MAPGLRDNRAVGRRVTREPEEVIRAKRKLMLSLSQSDSRLGLRTHNPPGDLVHQQNRALSLHTQGIGANTALENKEVSHTETNPDVSVTRNTDLELVDLELENIDFYDNDNDQDEIVDKEVKAESKQSPVYAHTDSEQLPNDRIEPREIAVSLRVYEGQTVPYFPYLGPDKKQNKRIKNEDLKQKKIRADVKCGKDNNPDKPDKLGKVKDKKKNKNKILRRFNKAQSAKIYPINVPDNSTKARTKAELEIIAAMFCVESRRDTDKIEAKRVVVKDESDDDDDCFRPGVWGCEFADVNLAKADVDYCNVDLNMTQPQRDIHQPSATVVHLDDKVKVVDKGKMATKVADKKKSRNAFIKFLRRLFRLKN